MWHKNVSQFTQRPCPGWPCMRRLKMSVCLHVHQTLVNRHQTPVINRLLYETTSDITWLRICIPKLTHVQTVLDNRQHVIAQPCYQTIFDTALNNTIITNFWCRRNGFYILLEHNMHLLDTVQQCTLQTMAVD